jgi:hypothetical protein
MAGWCSFDIWSYFRFIMFTPVSKSLLKSIKYILTNLSLIVSGLSVLFSRPIRNISFNLLWHIICKEKIGSPPYDFRSNARSLCHVPVSAAPFCATSHGRRICVPTGYSLLKASPTYKLQSPCRWRSVAKRALTHKYVRFISKWLHI